MPCRSGRRGMMAKFPKSFQGVLDHALSLLHQAVMDGSTTASLVDGSDFR